MLYTESCEGPSPLAAAQVAAEPAVSWTEMVANRLARPRVDMGVVLGSSSVRLQLPGKTVVQAARVAVDQQTTKIVALGDQALSIEGRESKPVEVQRPIEHGVVRNQVGATRLLQAVIRASRHGLLTGPRMLLCVPGALDGIEREGLLMAARGAGAREVHMVDRVLLCAIGAGVEVQQPKGRLVVHLGAGFTEFAIVSMASVVARRTLRSGGDALTEAVRAHVRRRHRVLLGDSEAEKVKRELGAAMPGCGRSLEVAGRCLAEGKPVSVKLEAGEIAEVLAPLLRVWSDELRLLLAEIEPRLLKDLVSEAAVLTGGGASLRRLCEFLGEASRLKFSVCQRPAEAVSRGMTQVLRDRYLRRRLLAERGVVQAGTSAKSGSGRAGVWAATLLVSAGLLGCLSFSSALSSGRPTPVDQWLNQYMGAAYKAAAPEQDWEVTQKRLSDEKQRRLDFVRSENERLRRLVGLKEVDFGKVAAARVVARDPKGWLSFLTLDKGRGEIAEGAVVTDGRAVVGVVDTVGAETSRVRLLSDSSSVVAAQVGKTAGVLHGQGRGMFELKYLDPDAAIEVGDKVFSSKQQTDFPSGLFLGRIERIDRSSDANSVTALVQSSVDLDNLLEVVVLENQK